MTLQNADTVFINYKREENGQVCGNLTISKNKIEDQPKDTELFSVQGIDYNYGAIVKKNGSYLPYYSIIEYTWQYMIDENFGKAEKTFREALLKLVSESDEKIILDGKFYKLVKTQTKVDIEPF